MEPFEFTKQKQQSVHALVDERVLLLTSEHVRDRSSLVAILANEPILSMRLYWRMLVYRVP